MAIKAKRSTLSEMHEGSFEIRFIVSRADIAEVLEIPLGALVEIERVKPPAQKMAVNGIDPGRFGNDWPPLAAHLMRYPPFQAFVQESWREAPVDDSERAAAMYLDQELLAAGIHSVVDRFITWHATKYGKEPDMFEG